MNKKMFLLRKITSHLVLLLVTVVVGLVSPGSTWAKDTVFPLAPQKLLKFFPPRVENWDITRSQGYFDSSGKWVMCDANRAYESEIPEIDPDTGKPTGEMLKVKVDINVKDTGFFEDYLIQFSTLEEIDTPQYVSGKIDGRPSIFRYRDNGDCQFKFLVGGRFIVSIKTNGLVREDAEKWLSKFDVATLATAPARKMSELPQPVPAVFYDELNPENSRQVAIVQTHASGLFALEREEISQLLESGKISREEAKKRLEKIDGTPLDNSSE